MTLPGSASVGEDALIELLLRLDDGFHDDLLVYECIPDDPGEFNSNSFLSGLLKAGDLPDPSWRRAPNRYLVLVPGWEKPVPAVYFQP